MLTVNSISGFGVINEHCYSYHVPLTTVRADMLVDAQLSVYGLYPLKDILRGTADLRIYSGEHDLTSYYVASLLKQIRRQEASYLAQYKREIGYWKNALLQPAFSYNGDKEADAILCDKLLTATTLTFTD